jgi:DNA-binding XRE family transcriptional regulator
MTNPIEELRRLTVESTQAEVAKNLGISTQYLNDVIKERRLPGKKILAALGLTKTVSYQKNEG